MAAQAGPADESYVIGITNRHHLEGMPDPIIAFIDAATAHGENLVVQGL